MAAAFVGVSGSHALQHFVSEAARDVKDPETGASVLARAVAEGSMSPHYESRPAHGSAERRTASWARWARVRTYTPFLQHLGVNSLNIGFEGELITASITPPTIRSIIFGVSSIPRSSTVWRSPRSRAG